MKSGVYTQIYLQLVFAVKNRDAVLNSDMRKRVFEYMSGINTKLGHKSIIVNGHYDHAHLFIGLNPNISISDTMHDIKRNTSIFINKNKLCYGHFNWQEGYGAFSYGRSQINDVFRYIQNQEAHHSKRTFREEYIEFLKEYGIGFDSQYLFDFFD
ncbi:MAG: IS200/IS605 family transposase [Candidatus Marinimicrobia bacterium]|nr:IS200/IS605 family transposase [Candidatus Neomarinimicrobiota bacterium]